MGFMSAPARTWQAKFALKNMPLLVPAPWCCRELKLAAQPSSARAPWSYMTSRPTKSSQGIPLQRCDADAHHAIIQQLESVEDQMDAREQFESECRENIAGMGSDQLLKECASRWFQHSLQYKYSYNFSSLGRPIIQYPQDMVAMQELVWLVRPDLIIETGIAHGGSLILSAS